MLNRLSNVHHSSAEAAADRLDDYALSLRERGRNPRSPWDIKQSLPLPEVDFSLTVEPEEFKIDASWPPARFGERQARLDLLHRWRRGDLSDMIDQRLLDVSGVAATSVFGRMVQFTGDLALREPPTVGVEDEDLLNDRTLYRLASDLIGNAITYGASFLLYSETAEGALVRVVDSRYILPRTDGGWLIAEPRTSPGSQTPLPDVNLVQNIDPDGNTTIGLYTNAYSTIGVGPTSVVPSVLGTSMVIPVLAYPAVADHWGQNWFEDIATFPTQKTRATAGYAMVLDANSNPILKVVMPVGSNALRGKAEGDKRPAEVYAESVKAELRKHAGVVVVSDQAAGMEYLTWDGNVDNRVKQIAHSQPKPLHAF